MTTESRIADKHQRREICLKNLRECAIYITKGNSINQIDTLLRDQVRYISILNTTFNNFSIPGQI